MVNVKNLVTGLVSEPIKANTKSEVLSIADTVAREKGISSEEVLQAIEHAIQKASKQRYGTEQEIEVEIDRNTGSISLYIYREVVSEGECVDEVTQIHLSEAQKVSSSYKVGDFAKYPLPPVDFSRVAVQTTRQVIYQRVREASRLQQYEEFKDRVGTIVSGIVKRVEFNNAIVEIARSECFLARDQMIPRESFRSGDRVRAYVMSIRPESRGHQVFLSRTHPQFLGKLFAQEVPEIYEGIIQIKAIARDPGSRSKVAVSALERSLDPVKSCVGMRGVRVRSIIAELQGEKIDVLLWSDSPKVLLTRALVPAEVSEVRLIEERKHVDVVVPDDQLSLALGRRGQNVRLASMLVNLGISIISESDDCEQRARTIKGYTSLLVKELKIDDVVARLLVNEGFETIEKIASSQVSELIALEGIEKNLAEEFQRRASDWIVLQDESYRQRSKLLDIDESLLNLGEMTSRVAVALGENGVKTLDDLGNLALDELVEILPNLDTEQAGRLIMKAREKWFH